MIQILSGYSSLLTPSCKFFQPDLSLIVFIHKLVRTKKKLPVKISVFIDIHACLFVKVVCYCPYSLPQENSSYINNQSTTKMDCAGIIKHSALEWKDRLKREGG